MKGSNGLLAVGFVVWIVSMVISPFLFVAVSLVAAGIVVHNDK